MIWLYSLMLEGTALEIPHEKYQLENGLNIILIEDHTSPQIVVNTWYQAGSYDDPKGASGFAHLFEHLMFMGTPTIPNGRFDINMEIAGGWNNATTGDDRTNYYDVGPSEITELLLFMEADRMINLNITQDKLDSERKVVQNERRQNYEDAPYGKIWLEMPEMLYPESHPYHMEGIGSHEDLQAATLNTVTEFYQDWYTPSNATLCIAGDFDPRQIKETITKYYGQLEKTEVQEHQPFELQTQPVVTSKTITDSVPLPAMLLMWHSPVVFKEGDAEADILSEILAGSASANLSKKLVYDEQLVQDISVFQYSRGRGSVFIVYIDALEDTDLDKVQQIVQAELDGLASGEIEISEKNLQAILRQWEMKFLWDLEGLLERADTLQRYHHYVNDTNYISKDLQRYKDVTPESIRKLISTYLSAEKISKLIVLPEDSSEGEKQ